MEVLLEKEANLKLLLVGEEMALEYAVSLLHLLQDCFQTCNTKYVHSHDQKILMIQFNWYK